MIEIEIEGILFGLEGLKGVTSLKDFEKVVESLNLKDVSKAWETILKAKKKSKKG
jgi:hypothetical protein